MNPSKTDVNQGKDSIRGKKMENTNIWFDFWIPLFITLGLYVGIRSYIAEARYIPSGSMLPGLQINDRLLIEKITFRNRVPKRGEIVVFNSPYAFDEELLAKRSKRLPSSFKCVVSSLPLINYFPSLGDPACDAYIKRIVAVGGDQVWVNSKGEVSVNGQKLIEPYAANYCSFNFCNSLDLVVPMSHVLVLGDNRSNSWDSRFWPGGPLLPEAEIIGRAVWRFWPLDRIGTLKH
ncbi:signal peptidase I [Prochlorococcus sp. MIT 1223]|uniref:signal peptidase I n=1 Tax=Prochlorococcus sp. MIT 1223 TaxID=3096217 RepID=UPI0039C1A43C